MGVEIDLLAFAERPADWSLSEQQHYSSFFRDVMLFDSPRRPSSELMRRAAIPSARFPKRAENSFAPELWHEIERRLTMQSYDVVHLFGGVQVYEFAHLLHDYPTVITPYESYSLLLERTLKRTNHPRHWLTTRAQLAAASAYERWMFAPYDVVTVVSDKDRDHLHHLNPRQQIEVIPNGIHLAAFPLADSPPNPRQIMFLGNYEYAPNVDAALFLAKEILPRVRQSVPDVHLLLVGNAPPPELTILAETHITVTGRVPNVLPYFSESTAFVCPLRIGAGIKNKVLEALASGCAVVATGLSVDGIAVRHGEHVLLGETADALAIQTVRLLQDRALRQDLSTQGRALVEQHYTWSQTAAAYLAIYKRLQDNRT